MWPFKRTPVEDQPAKEPSWRDWTGTEIVAHCRRRAEALGLVVPDAVWQFHPWGDRVVVQREKAETHWGLVEIPEVHRRPPAHGRIITMGPDVDLPDASAPNLRLPAMLDPLALPGRRVIFGMYSGSPLMFSAIDDESGPGHQSPYVLMRTKDIWGILWDAPEQEGT